MIPSTVLRLVFLSILTMSLRAESPALVLERAHQKEVLHDISSAIDLYRRVTSNPGHALRWRAEATVGLARCHEQMESYVTANTHYLNVIKEFGQFKALADSAGERILAISRILAQDSGPVSGGDFLYLNDLVLSLHGALKNDDRKLASDVLSELEKHLSRLAKAVEGTGEDELVNQSSRELSKIKGSYLKDLPEASKQLEKADNLGLFIDAGYENDPGELFNPVLRWKDRLLHFLTEGNLAKAKRFSDRIENYLKPLVVLPESDEQELALHFTEQVQGILAALEKNDFPTARRVFFLADQTCFQEQLVMAVYLEGFEYLPSNHLPYLSASSEWVEHALTSLETKPELAKSSVKKALEVSVELQAFTEIPEFAKENAAFIKALEKAMKAFEANKFEEVRIFLEGGGESK